jgi:arginase
MIELIGVPFDLTGKSEGSRLGPDGLRLAGIAKTLEALGETVTDSGDLPKPCEETADHGIRNFKQLLSCVTALKAKVSESIKAGNIPIVMGGDHAISTGSVSGALAVHQKTALLWVDAHADVNDVKSSPSGNFHGMPVGALLGLPSGVTGTQDLQWKQMLDTLGPNRLQPANTAWYGLREVDHGERPHTHDPALAITMHAIDRYGIAATVDQFDQWMRANKCTHLWISFDCDCIDPVFAPGTGTAVRGGLTYREAHLLAELLREKLDAPGCPYKLSGVDLVEVNPIRDTTNMTALVTVEWAASLFGKTILGKR